MKVGGRLFGCCQDCSTCRRHFTGPPHEFRNHIIESRIRMLTSPHHNQFHRRRTRKHFQYQESWRRSHTTSQTPTRNDDTCVLGSSILQESCLAATYGNPTFLGLHNTINVRQLTHKSARIINTNAFFGVRLRCFDFHDNHTMVGSQRR